MALRNTRHNLAAVIVLIALVLGFAIIMAKFSDKTPPNWTSQTMKEKQLDALQLIQKRFAPSNYAVNMLPAAVAAGEWSSNRNVWNCNNPGETRCVEVDFTMPSVNVECKWLVSYDRATADLIDYRALNEAASNLFMVRVPQERPGPVDYAGRISLEANDGSTTSDAINLIKSDYSPKTPSLYSSMQAQWVAEKKNTLINGDEVIAVRFTESKADTPSEWIVELSPGIHNHYQLLRTNAEVSVDFVQRNSALK